MALTDGSHGFEQDFSYFTLKREARGDRPASSLFAISCTMQLDARLLKEKKAEVTRSTVQKAVVVITDSPVYFGHLREQLVMVTSAWFAQRNFDDLEIIKVHSRTSAEFERAGILTIMPCNRNSEKVWCARYTIATTDSTVRPISVRLLFHLRSVVINLFVCGAGGKPLSLGGFFR